MGKKKKIRADFRKNRESRTRQTDLTRQFEQHAFEEEDPLLVERISGKGKLTRRRTVTGTEVDTGDEPGLRVELDVDREVCRRGRVLSVHGLSSVTRIR